jgi:hypothetical protein
LLQQLTTAPEKMKEVSCGGENTLFLSACGDTLYQCGKDGVVPSPLDQLIPSRFYTFDANKTNT